MHSLNLFVLFPVAFFNLSRGVTEVAPMTGVYYRFPKARLGTCFRWCQYARVCGGVEWQSNTNECRLFVNDTINRNTGMEPTGVYFSREDATIQGHPCSNRPCSEDHICVPVIRSEAYQCMLLQSSDMFVVDNTTSQSSNTPASTTGIPSDASTTDMPTTTTVTEPYNPIIPDPSIETEEPTSSTVNPAETTSVANPVETTTVTPETQTETTSEIHAETTPATQNETTPATQNETTSATQAETAPETENETTSTTPVETTPATHAETTPETHTDTPPATQNETTPATENETTAEIPSTNETATAKGTDITEPVDTLNERTSTTTSTTVSAINTGCTVDLDCTSFPDTTCRDGQCVCSIGHQLDLNLQSCVSIAGCTTFLDEYTMYDDLYIGKNNIITLQGSDEENCNTRCNNEATFLCKSFEMYQTTCFLQSTLFTEVAASDHEISGQPYIVQHYQRKCVL